MGSDSFAFTFAWGDRGHSPAQIGEKILRSTEALREIDRLFETWWFTDLVALEHVPLEQARPRMTDLVEQGVVTDDDDEPEPQSGYSSLIVSDTTETATAAHLRIHDGCQNRKTYFGNSGSFSTSFDQRPDPALVNYRVFKSAMMAMVRVWDASSAQAFGGDVGEIRRKANRLFPPAWMTYLAPPLLARVTPPSGVLCEPTPDGGLLMIATEQTFDPANPDHMAASWTISDALVPLTRKEFLFS